MWPTMTRQITCLCVGHLPFFIMAKLTQYISVFEAPLGL